MKKPVWVYVVFLLNIVSVKAVGQTAENSLLPGGAGNWQLVWSDEFDYPDSYFDQKWDSQNGPSGYILCSRLRENAVVSNGTLKLVNRKENRGGQEWTSSNIWTKEQFKYGYFECRYRYAAVEGTAVKAISVYSGQRAAWNQLEPVRFPGSSMVCRAMPGSGNQISGLILPEI
jgi:beta-glucanase (GH16 family)